MDTFIYLSTELLYKYELVLSFKLMINSFELEI